MASTKQGVDDQKNRQMELLAKARVIRENVRRDWFPLTNKVPGITYIPEIRDANTLSRRFGMGYQIVKSDPGNSGHVQSRHMQKDGTHILGDLILLQIPTEEYDALKLASELESLERTNQGRERFLGFARKEGVPARQLEQDTGKRVTA